MKNQFLNICLVILFSYSLGFTQPVNKQLKDVVMPTPNAASMGKFTDVPVDYGTGVPNISVPIHTISYGNLSASVSLSYHAGGVKLGEPATWVGLNWNLNAGGMISRTVLSLPDDLAGGYYSNGSNLPNTFNSCETGVWDNSFQNGLESQNQGVLDLQPDLFNLSYPGGSVKFYFNHLQQLIKVNQENDDKINLISWGGNVFAGFEIISTDGTKYYFGQINSSSANNVEKTQVGGNSPYTTSWLMSKIVSSDDKYAINYDYINENYTSISKQSRSYTFSNISGATGINNAASGQDIPNHAYHSVSITGKRLYSISTLQDSMVFHANTARLDMTGNRLDSISIFSISNKTNFCKRFKLTYDYFEDGNYSAYSYSKRLQLKEVQEKSCDNSILINPYVFEYEGNLINSKIYLPHRLSHQVDHWGYYNGKVANESFAVNVPATTVNAGVGGPMTYGNADRNTDTTLIKHGTIKKITYPTGGSSNFAYEVNRVGDNVSSGTTYAINNLNTCVYPSAACCGIINASSSAMSFTAPQISNLKFNLNGVKPSECSSGSNSYLVELRILNGATQIGYYSLNFTLPQTQGGVVNIPVTNVATLVAGTPYTFKITSYECRGELSVYYDSYTYQQVPAPGLRVKSITMDDAISTANNKITSFDYLNSGDMMVKKPTYTKVNFGASPDYSIIWNDINIAPASDFTSNTVIYSQVKVSETNNGYSLYSFNNSSAYYYSYSYFTEFPCSASYPGTWGTFFQGCYSNSCPVGPISSNAGIRGKMTGSKTYNQAGSLLAETAYTYSDVKTNSTSMMAVSESPMPGILTYALYKIESSKVRVSTEVKSQDNVSTTSTYAYDALNRHSFPISKAYTNSDGKTQLEEYSYIFDYTSNSQIKDSIIKKNIIASPFMTLKKVNGTLVDGTEAIYAWYNTATGAFQGATSTAAFPRFSQNYRYEYTYNSAGTLIGTGRNLQATINYYDAYGNVGQVTQVGWQPETIVWNSNGTMKSRTFDIHTKEYRYYPGTMVLDTFYDIDGQFLKYQYDKLSRVSMIRERGGNVVTNISYNYKSVSDPYNWMKTIKTYTPIIGSSLSTIEEKQYIDGLGRPLQTVKRNHATSSNDLVVDAVAYDNKGRVIRKYRPYQSTLNTGAYVTIPTNHKFDSIEYEPSPLNRTSGVIPADWYRTSTVYGTNAANEVILWQGTTQNWYGVNTLIKTTMTDASNRIKISYSDKKGRAIMSKMTKVGASGSEITETYQIYDDKDRLNKVIPPGATPSTAELIFTYLYDQKDNMIQKKVPGQSAVDMVYNDQDLMTFYKDGNLGNATYNENFAANQWIMTKFDVFGRPTSSGFYTSATTPAGNNVATTFTKQISSTTFGTTGIEKGKVKQSRSLILGNYINGTTWLETNNFFDTYGRLRYSTGNNHLNTALDAQCHYYSYDFADHILTDTTKHKPTGAITHTIVNRNTYDYLGRPLNTYNKINAGTEQHLANFVYNFRGELQTKSLSYGLYTPTSTNTYLQKLDYLYNTQGWLTSINNGPLYTGVVSPTNPDHFDAFRMDLNYDTAPISVTGVTPTLDKSGNISQMIWQNKNMDAQGYVFDYDFISRVSNSKYFEQVGGASTGTYNQKYNENLTYDLRGNITSLLRNTSNGTTGATLCDNLGYTYNASSNVLSKISDASANSQGFNLNGALGTATYAYDLNGSIYKDPYKKIDSTRYYYNNLPKDVYVNLGAGNLNKIRFTYDAGGMKLRKQVFNNGNVSQIKQDYVQGIEYRNDTIEAIYTSEGRAVWVPITSTWRYEFNVMDHLGNVRAVISDIDNNKTLNITTNSATNEIINVTSYYPFGMVMANSNFANNTSTPDTKYQYNGKEYNGDLGLNLLDYGARWYDPAVGRFTSVDKLSDDPNQFDKSPYAYGWDRPILLSDPDGNFPIVIPVLVVAAEAALDYLAGTTIVVAVAATIDNLVKNSGSIPAPGNQGIPFSAQVAQNNYLKSVKGDSSKKESKASSTQQVPNKLEKSPTGPGTVPKSDRDPKRVPSEKVKKEQLKSQDYKCANCDKKINEKESRSHHYPLRFSDGGKETVQVCIPCHNLLHKKN